MQIGNMKVPTNSLEVLLDATKKIYKDSSGKEISKARIAEILGHSPGGTFSTKMADLRDYGLIEGRKNNILVTKLGKQATVPRDDSEKNAALLKAVKNIPLWKKLLEDVGTSIKPENFWHHLADITGAERSVAKDNADAVRKAYLKDVGLIKFVGEPIQAPLMIDMGEAETADGNLSMEAQPTGGAKKTIGYIGFPEYSKSLIEIKDKLSYNIAKQLLKAIGVELGEEKEEQAISKEEEHTESEESVKNGSLEQ